MSLECLFNPRGVVVVGSMSPGKLGYELLKQIVAGGYSRVYAVNPRAQGALGIAGFNAISAIHEVIDLAVIAAPPESVADVLLDCHAAGVRAAVVITSGFSEIGNHAGEEKIKQLGRELGIRIVGPNCAGITSSSSSLYATLETRPPAGNMALISQSGALGGAVLSWAEEQGVGLSKFVSYGNRTDLDELELLPYLAQDEDTIVVALYIESVTDGRRFMQVVREFTAVKPLVVIKSGRSNAGQRAALSHTGSMAGSDAVYDAALKKCGALRVETIEEMFDLCKGFVMLDVPRGRHIIVVTNSGGPGILTADRAEKAGMLVSEPSEDLKRSIRTRLGANSAVGNPVDLTVQGDESGFREVLKEALTEYDAAVAINVATPYLDSVSLARGIRDAARDSAKPVAACFMAGRLVAESVKILEMGGIPNYATGERAASVLARMTDYGYRKSTWADVEFEESIHPLEHDEGILLEPEAMALLRENGFPVPAFSVAHTPAEVLAGCRQLRFPVVMKIVSPDILHKSDVGGVITHIEDEQTALQSFETLKLRAGGRRFEGVVIYPMVTQAQEILLGLSRDPQFGPVVMVGAGGIYTEIFTDISIRVAPILEVEALEMLAELKVFPLLRGVRGQRGVDMDGLAGLVARFSQLAVRYPQIQEVDINPLFVSSSGMVIGDARVILGKVNNHA